MPLPAGSMVRRFDLFGIILGLAGLTVIAVTPLEQRGLLLTGMFVTFLGAVLYGGVPSRNAIESVLTKIQFPMLIMAAVTALLISFVFGKPLIRKLRTLKAGQEVREDGPETHLTKS